MRIPSVAVVAIAVALAQGVPAQTPDPAARAREAMAAQDWELAAAWWGTVLAERATDREALAGMVTATARLGRWRDAMAFAQRYVTVDPDNAPIQHALGRWLTWAGDPAAGANALRAAVRLAPDSVEYRRTLGEFLTWRAETRAEGIAALRVVVAAGPADPTARLALARALSWQGTRAHPEAVAEYERVLAIAPHDSIRREFAEMLTWSNDTRGRAASEFQERLRRDPTDARALQGLANAYAWSGQLREAAQVLATATAAHPGHTGFIIGRASLLSQLGDTRESRRLLARVLADGRRDPGAELSLAWSAVGLRRWSEAEAAARRAAEAGAPEEAVGAVLTQVRRGRAPWIALDAAGADNNVGVGVRRGGVAVGSTVSTVGLALSVAPGRFTTRDGDFAQGRVAIAVSPEPWTQASTRVEVGVARYGDGPAFVDGTAQLKVRPNRRVEIESSLRRFGVEDTRQAAEGPARRAPSAPSADRGAVRAILAAGSLRVAELPARLDLTLGGAVGSYRGTGLEPNRRVDASLGVGRVLRSLQPYVRLDAGVQRMSFAYDAFTPDRPQRDGGYWSPVGLTTWYAAASATHRLTRAFEASASASVGAQLAGDVAAATRDIAVTARAELGWFPHPALALTAGASHFNILGAFRQTDLRLGMRRGF